MVSDIPKEDLRDILKIELGSLDKAETVIDYIQTRAGLLQAEDHRIYRFPHRPFQEYLAATHILKRNEPVTMLKKTGAARPQLVARGLSAGGGRLTQLTVQYFEFGEQLVAGKTAKQRRHPRSGRSGPIGRSGSPRN